MPFFTSELATVKYSYYIQEIGYRTANGEYRTDVNGTFKPVYDHWVGTEADGAYTGSPVGMNDFAGNNIRIGAKGENRLKVINSTEPSTRYTVTKAFHGPQSATGGQSSVTGKYPTDGSKQVVLELEQRYRYEKTEGGVDYVSADNTTWVRADSDEAVTTWIVNWQTTESASTVSVVLPLDKPAGSVLSDEAWYGSAAAWTYTWEGLDVTKVVSEAADPEDSLVAKLYYRAVEVSTPSWFSSTISAEEANRNTVTNERNDCNLNLNKEWTGLGEGKTWPDGVTIDYQLVQHFRLALADMSTVDQNGHIIPSYSTGTVFKSVDMTTTTMGAANADSVHPQAIGINVGKPSDSSTVIARITGLPVYGFLTATAEDVEEAARAGVTLVEGTVYPVVYTYSAKETAVKKNGIPIGFKEQTVDAELDATVSSPVTYKATLTNELVSVTVEKDWNGFTPTTDESATIQLRRFKKDIEPEPETTFTYTVSVTGSEDALSSNGTVTAVIYNEENEEAGRYVLKKNDWSHNFELEIGGTYHAAFEADGTILESVTPLADSDITEAGSINLTATVKPAASGSVKVVVTGSPSGLWMNPLQDSNGTELSPQKNFNSYFHGQGGETGVLDGLTPGVSYRFQIGAAPNSVDGATYNSQFVYFTATDGLTTITLNYSGGGGETAQTTTFDPSSTTVSSGTINGQHGSLTSTNPLIVGTEYEYNLQVQGLDAGLLQQYSINITGATYSVGAITDYYNGQSGNIQLYVTPTEAGVPVVINVTFGSGNRTLSTRSRAASKTLAVPQLRAPASITWTNNTSSLPVGANTNTDDVVDTVTFSGTTWSKTWNELPKYSDDGKEYVYYAYETDYAGATGATELVTTYSIEADGTIKVTNTPTFPNLGNLKVTKEVFYGDTLATDAAFNGRTFTVGIFSDAAGTTPVDGQPNKTLTINNGTGEVVFEDLTEGTYYVYEVVNGNPVTTSGTVATIDSVSYSVTYTNNTAQVTNGNTAETGVKNTLTPYSLNILKVDAAGMTTPLAGARFMLQKIDGEATAVSAVGDPVDPETSGTDHKTGSDGSAVFANLAMGYYEIAETALPDGYVLTNSDGKFYIKVAVDGISLIEKTANTAAREWPSKGNSATLTFNAQTATATVGNTPGAALPNTGGPGTNMLYFFGILLTGLAGTGLVMKRRRRKNVA